MLQQDEGIWKEDEFLFKLGGARGARTPDLFAASEALSQLS